MNEHEAHAPSAEGPSGGDDWAAPRSLFDDAWTVFRRVSGPRLPVSRVLLVTRALRQAVMKYADEPVPEILSGHAADGAPSQRPHAAYVAVPAVGSYRDRGEIAGLAIVLPRAASDQERALVARATAAWTASARGNGHQGPALYLGQAGVLPLAPIEESAPPPALRTPAWCRLALRWASVTPVVLDRFPGRLHSDDPQVAARAEAQARIIIARSCQRIGLPAPAHVDITWQSMVSGAPPAHELPPYPGLPGRQQRFFVHTVITFSMPVAGPLLIGAGRYEGMGLLRPL